VKKAEINTSIALLVPPISKDFNTTFHPADYSTVVTAAAYRQKLIARPDKV